MIMRRVGHIGMARWRPAAFEPIDTIVSTWFLVVAAAVRGTDYLRTHEESSPSLSYIEKAFPLTGWGVCFVTGAAILASGLIFERHFLIWLGHTILGITYIVLALGLIIPMLTLGAGIIIGLTAIAVAFATLLGRIIMPSFHPKARKLIGRLAVATVFIATLLMPPGLRTGVQTAYIAAGHFLLWLRTGSSPLEAEESHTTSHVQGGADAG